MAFGRPRTAGRGGPLSEMLVRRARLGSKRPGAYSWGVQKLPIIAAVSLALAGCGGLSERDRSAVDFVVDTVEQRSASNADSQLQRVESIKASKVTELADGVLLLRSDTPSCGNAKFSGCAPAMFVVCVRNGKPYRATDHTFESGRTISTADARQSCLSSVDPQRRGG